MSASSGGPGAREGAAERLVPVLAAAAAVLLVLRHAVAYAPLFDDFAIFGELPATPLGRILAEPLGGFYRPAGLAFMKVEALLFGLGRPWGLAAGSALLHAANAALLVLLLRRAGHGRAPSRAAGALFLASPWAGEAFFWASAQFDLLATLGVLLALLAVQAALRPEGRSALPVLLACGAAGLALASKESSVTLAAAGPLALLGLAPRARRAARPLAAAAAALGLLTAAFLVLRAHVLPALRGPYGDFGTLVSGGAGLRNLLSHVVAFLRPPFAAQGPALALLQAGWAALLLLLLARALRGDAAGTALGLAAVAAALGPVAVLPTGAASIPSGRLLYLPGMLLVLVLAGSPGAGVPAPRLARSAAAALLALALASLGWQQALWRSACALSRNVIAAVAPYASSDRPLLLVGLPLRFERGPHVLKSYAFRYAFPGRGVPPVRAEGVVLENDPGRLRVARREPDPFSEGAPDGSERRLRLALDDSWLR